VRSADGVAASSNSSSAIFPGHILPATVDMLFSGAWRFHPALSPKQNSRLGPDWCVPRTRRIVFPNIGFGFRLRSISYGMARRFGNPLSDIKRRAGRGATTGGYASIGRLRRCSRVLAHLVVGRARHGVSRRPASKRLPPSIGGRLPGLLLGAALSSRRCSGGYKSITIVNLLNLKPLPHRATIRRTARDSRNYLKY